MKVSNITENIPTPDEVADRVTKYLASRKHIKAAPSKPRPDDNTDEWHRDKNEEEQRIRDRQAFGESSDMPEPGDNIRTRKTKMEGKVKRVNGNMVIFQLTDGRMMKTSVNNVIVIEKLADENDDIMEDELNEISNELLARYKTAAGKDASAADKASNVKKGDKRFNGIIKATNKQFSNDKKNNISEVDMNNFTDILNTQHKEVKAARPKAKVVDIDFHGWIIRYRPAEAGQKTKWMILDRNYNKKTDGESVSDTDAVKDAEQWIQTGGGTGQKSTKFVTIDFNVDFAKEFGDTFFANIEKDNNGPVLIISYIAQPGVPKRSNIRTQKDKQTSGTTNLPCISLSAKEANSLGLQANGRYILGAKGVIDDNTIMFPLELVSTVMGKGDMMKLGKPGLTVATSREMDENIESPHSYDPADTVTVDVPLLIRIMEYAKEDAKSDLDLHNVAEKLIGMSREGRTLTMDDYDNMVADIEEGTMGGINRCAPATDVSYERMLDDVYDTWMGDRTRVKESSNATLTGSYTTRLKQIMKSK